MYVLRSQWWTPQCPPIWKGEEETIGELLNFIANLLDLYSKRIEGSIKDMQEKTEGKKMEVSPDGSINVQIGLMILC